jgi:hypothetical protein
MSLQERCSEPSALVRLGMVCLLFASALNWFGPPPGGFARELSDGMMGLLYGLSSGLTLRAVWLGRNSRV